MIIIDGSMGEGGGQVLRTSLALSLVTSKPFTIENIRAGRKKPGLMRQHLTAVKAAKEVGQADVDGAELKSTKLVFHPGKVKSGDYTFSIGSAGSATLVLQTVLPPLLVADGESHLTLEGGTHNPWAPPFCFLKKTFIPAVNRMGVEIDARILAHGFYPAGGGKFEVDIKPAKKLKPFDLLSRGETKSIKGRCILANLPMHIAERELSILKKKLSLSDDQANIEFVKDPRGPGNVLIAEVETEELTELFISFGERGVRAEAVAERVAKDTRRYLGSDAPVGVYLADQLLIPMAMAGGGSFKTFGVTSHTQTNIEVIKQFLDVDIKVEGEKGKGWLVSFS